MRAQHPNYATSDTSPCTTFLADEIINEGCYKYRLLPGYTTCDYEYFSRFKMDQSILPPHLPHMVVLCLLGALGVALWRRSFVSNQLPLPPQVKGNLILGNLSDIFKASSETLQHLLVQDWAREYGEVLRVRLGPVTEYFLNSDRAVKVSKPCVLKFTELVLTSGGNHGPIIRYIVRTASVDRQQRTYLQ